MRLRSTSNPAECRQDAQVASNQLLALQWVHTHNRPWCRLHTSVEAAASATSAVWQYAANWRSVGHTGPFTGSPSPITTQSQLLPEHIPDLAPSLQAGWSRTSSQPVPCCHISRQAQLHPQLPSRNRQRCCRRCGCFSSSLLLQRCCPGCSLGPCRLHR